MSNADFNEEQFEAEKTAAVAAAVAAERERWVFAVRKVIDADNAYGVGFSNTPNWREAYERLRSMAYEGA